MHFTAWLLEGPRESITNSQVSVLLEKLIAAQIVKKLPHV
jgi:hypothetical protein